MEDHFVINVARRVKPQTEPFGPYHEHLFRAEIPAGRTKAEASELYTQFLGKWPEPDFTCSLTLVAVRYHVVHESLVAVTRVAV